MSFKAINNSVGPNELVSTLLDFCAYPKMTKSDALSLSMTQRVIVMKKAMDEIQIYTTSDKLIMH